MTLNPETELLLACIRPTRSLSLVNGSVNGQPVDWTRFVRLATNHHIIPLVYRALKQEISLPVAVREQLRRDRMQIAAHGVRATYVLQRLQQRAAEQRIELIPVKGPALAVLAYGRGHESMRQFEDLDLVVRYRDLPRAILWLEGEGYELRELLVKPAIRRRYLATQQDWGLRKAADPLLLEVKPTLVWHTLCGHESVNYLSASCQPLPLDDSRVLQAPGPEAMLLAVCIDGTQDMWSKLSAIADVGHLLSAWPEADWPRLLDDAKAFGQKRTLLIGVRVAERLLNCQVPSPLEEAASRDVTIERLVDQVIYRIQDNIEEQPGLGKSAVFAFRTRERHRDRWRFIIRLLFIPSMDQMRAFRLPAMFFPFYALIRPFRLVWKVFVRR